MVCNSDTGNNYAQRNSWSGSEGTNTSRANFTFGDSSVHDSIFENIFIVNKSDKEKLMIADRMTVGSTGAGNVVNTAEQVAKWTNTSSQITSLTFNQTGSGSYVNAKVRVFGAD